MAAAAQNPRELAGCGRFVREGAEGTFTDDRIERPIRDRQSFGIANAKTHARGVSVREPLRRGSRGSLLDILSAVVDPKNLTAKTLRKE